MTIHSRTLILWGILQNIPLKVPPKLAQRLHQKKHIQIPSVFLLLSLAFCGFVCELNGISFTFRGWKTPRLFPAESCILYILGYAGNSCWVISSGSLAAVCFGEEDARPRARCSPTPDQEHPLAASALGSPYVPQNRESSGRRRNQQLRETGRSQEGTHKMKNISPALIYALVSD